MSEDQPQEPEAQNPEDSPADEERVIIPIEEAAQQPAEQPAEEAAAEEEPKPKKSKKPDVPDKDRQAVKGIIEALLFSSSSPLSAKRMASLAEIKSAAVVRSICEELKAEYDGQGRAFALEEIAGGYQLLTRPEYHTWLGNLRQKEQEDNLSQAALETLAIIAYRQPITRAQIEDVRGVQSGYILRSLIEKSLVSVQGRSEELGHPLLYATTKQFLDAFSLASLKDLPNLDELASPEEKE